MINRSCSIGLMSVFLFLGACGGGGGGQTSGTDSQSIIPESSAPSDTGTSAGTGTSTADTVAAAEAGTLSVGWVAPAARSNGDSLALSEIASYTVYFGTSVGDYPYSVTIDNASTTNLDIPDFPLGTYYLVITVTDTQGQESGYSNIAVKEVT